MRTLGGLSIALLLAGGVFAQRGNYNNIQPFLTGGFGNVVFPGGTSATVPGLQRFNPNVVYPGGGGPRLIVPNPNRQGRGDHGYGGRGFGDNRYAGSWFGYYPLYVGGFGYGYGVDSSLGGEPSAMPPPQAQQPQQSPVTVVYPPQPAPVIINQYGSGDSSAQAPVRPRMYDMPPAEAQAETQTETPEPTHYLIAFKDHTIYSATNYWVQGDTLHYFTAGNTHNQASLSLVDRDLTLRLNKESGVDIKLPPPQQ